MGVILKVRQGHPTQHLGKYFHFFPINYRKQKRQEFVALAARVREGPIHSWSGYGHGKPQQKASEMKHTYLDM